MNPFPTTPLPFNHWHNLPASEVLACLGTAPAQGLARDEAARRLAELGPNTLSNAEHRPLWRVLLRQFASPLIYILFVAAVNTS